MFVFGKLFDRAWSMADNVAKDAAAAVAVGAKAVGMIPVIAAHTEATITEGSETILHGIETAGARMGSAVQVKSVEWKAAMDERVARVESMMGKPINLADVDDRAHDEVRKAHENREDFLRNLHNVQQQQSASLIKKNQLQVAAAEQLGNHIANIGAQAGQGIRDFSKAMRPVFDAVGTEFDKLALRTLAKGIGFVTTVKTDLQFPFKAAKAFFECRKLGDPVEVCHESTAETRLPSEIANARANIQHARLMAAKLSAPEAAKLNAQADALQKTTDHAELALLSTDTYRGDEYNQPPPGWNRVVKEEDLEAFGLTNTMLSPNDSGFRAVLYKSTSEPPEYVLAFKGTTMTSSEDWENNLLQNFGINSDYYDRTTQVARAINASKPIQMGASLTLTGHSLGGGMASAAALATGKPAVIFNPAGLDTQTISGDPGNAGNISAYQVNGEPLSLAEGIGVMPPVVGEKLTLAARPSDGTLARHSMDAVMGGFESQMQNQEINLSIPAYSAASGGR